MSDTVQEIKDRLNIVDVVASYVKLTKAGKYHKGLCPFHKEKTSSFMVTADRGFYHCFGCGRGGDMFTFVQEIEGVDFRGALAILAEKAGVEITKEKPFARDRKEKVYAALESACDFYQEALRKNAEARGYVLGRGLTEKTISSWRIGFAKAEWRSLRDALMKDGFSEEMLLDAGLIKKPDRTDDNLASVSSYDRFRGRIMFPLSDVSGRVIGFSGRAYGKEDSQSAKYLNSPETVVFDKSRTLYGLDRAKEGIRKYNFTLLVEGQMDLLAAQQFMYPNAVALSGTAFTEHHAALVRRYSENLLIAFDGDSAGFSASGRAAELALKAGLNVKIAALPQGEDPADLIVRDADLFKKAVKEALHVVDFYLAHLKSLGFDERRYRIEVSRIVLPYVALIENAIDKAHFVERVSGALRVPESAVMTELKKLEKVHAKEAPLRAVRPAQKERPAAAPPAPFLSRGDTIERLIIGIALSLKERNAALSESVLSSLTELIGEERVKRLITIPEEARVAVIEGDLFLEEHALVDPSSAVESLFADLKKEMKRSAYRDALFSLKEAEQAGDQARVDELLQTVNVLAKEF